MNIIYKVIQLFTSLFKSNSVNERPYQYPDAAEVENTDSETSNEKPVMPLRNRWLPSTDERPVVSEKNTWLNPKDGFGKMEKGVVY